MIKNKIKIGLFDIETSPNIGAYFELYREGNILWNEEYWHIMSFAIKDLYSKKTYVYALPDYKLYKKDKNNDIELVKKLWEIFNTYDILISHNGQAFDMKKVMARFIFHKLPPPNPCKQVDTKLVAKKYFKFDSNKLDDLGDYFGVGRKLETEKGLWKRCREGDMKAWSLMKKYNAQDVILLEKIYITMLPFIQDHPNLALMNGEKVACPNCGSKNVNKRGFNLSRVSKSQRWQCRDCGSWHSSPINENSQIR